MLLAVVPVLAYGLAYAYKFGYAERLRIPREFVTLELTDVFFALGILAGLVLLLAALVQATNSIGSPHPGHRGGPGHGGSVVVRSLIGTPLVMTAVFAPFLVLYHTPTAGWLSLLALIVVTGPLPEALPALIARLRGGSFRERFRADEEARARNRDPLIDALMRPGRERVLALGFVVYLLFLAYHAGSASALYRDTFLVTNDSPPHAVLATYGDTVVVASFDPETRVLGDDRQIRKLSDDHPLEAEWQRTGRLDASSTTTTTSRPVDGKSE